MRVLLLAIIMSFCSSCCWMVKRDCFPPCPPKEVVTVEKYCTLPPPINADPIEMTEKDCPANYACFDKENFAKLAKRLSDMKTWIQNTRERCEKPVPPTTPTQPPKEGQEGGKVGEPAKPNDEQ